LIKIVPVKFVGPGHNKNIVVFFFGRLASPPRACELRAPTVRTEKNGVRFFLPTYTELEKVENQTSLLVAYRGTPNHKLYSQTKNQSACF
jgi:hypothetical protein